MTYEELIKHVARRSGITNARVRAVLEQLPVGLSKLKEGERVRTPLGVFVSVKTQPRMVLLPDRVTEVEAVPTLVVKLRPSLHLRREPD